MVRFRYSQTIHCVKSVPRRSFFWFEYRKIPTRKSPYLDTFQAVIFLRFTVILLTILKFVILLNFIFKLHIQSPVEHLRWSVFTELNNVLKSLVIFEEELLRGYLTGF